MPLLCENRSAPHRRNGMPTSESGYSMIRLNCSVQGKLAQIQRRIREKRNNNHFYVMEYHNVIIMSFFLHSRVAGFDEVEMLFIFPATETG